MSASISAKAIHDKTLGWLDLELHFEEKVIKSMYTKHFNCRY